MGSSNFVTFAADQGWFDPTAGEPFNVTAVYGTDEVRYPRSEMEDELRRAAPVSLREMLDAVRDRRLSKDATGYGQVAHLRSDVRPELATLWVAPTGAVTAPFIPWRIGVQDVPAEFGKHRYLTKGEANRFVTRDWQIQEATRFAGRLFKRLMYFTCDRPEKFLPEVTEALVAFEDQMIAEQEAVEAIANRLFSNGVETLAADYLTRYSGEMALQSLWLGEALLSSIEARTRILFGFREPTTDEMSRLDYQMVTCEP
jgi:hypothetical protein